MAEWAELSNDEHFSIDGTLLDAWASHKSFVRGDGGSNPTDDNSRSPNRDFKGEKRSNATHDRPLILMRAWHVRATATGMVEREESLKLMQANAKPGATVGEDRGYDADAYIKEVQALGIIPHVAAKRKGSAVPEDIRQSEGYAINLRIRKRIEKCLAG